MIQQQQIERPERRVDRATYYRDLLEQHERSGLSLRSFALRCGLSPFTLYTWRRRLSERRAVTAPHSGGLVAVDVVRSEPCSDVGPTDGYEVVLPDGCRVRAPSNFVASQLVELVSLLRAC